MKRHTIWLALLALLFAGVLGGCGKDDDDSDDTDTGTDAGDVTEDPTADPGTDPGTDPGNDPGEDPGEDPTEDPVDDGDMDVADADDGGDADDTGDDTDTGMMASGQLDRMGRPAVNTALIPSARKDEYNQADDPTMWVDLFAADIEASLDFVDGLDMTDGNALLMDSAALAGVLADDRLVIDTSASDCTDGYLAVETGVADNCGGRTLEQDVMDATLAALVGSPVSDNVDNDSAFRSSFPFLAPATTGQLDRMGRPAVNTALVPSGLKDAYNESPDPSAWAAQFTDEFVASLDFVDGLDGTAGNALLGDSTALAGVLVDDRIVIDTSEADCTGGYLAVETGVAGNCGGRTLEQDVMDATLAALVGTPISDNVDNDSAFRSTFPFVAPRNGNQLDRMGRPAVNTALVPSNLKDAYNGSENPAWWAAQFTDEFIASLDFVDGLDMTMGNALLGDSAALAGVLVDDRLIIDTSEANCGAYLAVELSVAGQCGGRTLDRDVMDDTLGALVGTPISDNVDNDSTFQMDFPFIGTAN